MISALFAGLFLVVLVMEILSIAGAILPKPAVPAPVEERV